MPFKYCVVHCATAYRSNKDNMSIFSFPNDENLKQKWINVIPRKNVIVKKKCVKSDNHI